MERNGLRVGKITALYPEKGTARILYTDQNKAVSKELPFLFAEIFPYKIDDLVWTARLSSNRTEGVILGIAFSEVTPPAEGKEGLYRKDFSRELGEAYIRFDPESKELKINSNQKLTITVGGSAKIIVSGDAQITASSGDVKIGSISLVNHTHTCPDGTTSKPQ